LPLTYERKKEERKMEMGKEVLKKIDEVVLVGQELDEDGLPKRVNLTNELMEKLPPLAPALIEGVVRVGHKMMISGA
jgi:hypothetical protein